jgi:hypothetical protein
MCLSKSTCATTVRLIKDGETASTWTGQRGFPGGKTPEWRAAEAEAILKAEAAADGGDADADVVLKPTPEGRPEREDVTLHGPCVLIEVRLSVHAECS